MDTDVLAKLIENKHSLLTQLHALAVRQAELIESGETSRMISLLAIKQRLLAAIEQLEHQLDPFRSQDPETRVWRSAEHRLNARSQSEACDVLLSQIMAIEKRCEANMLQRRDDAEKQVRAAHFSVHAAHAYSPAAETSGGHFDVSCES